MSTNPTESATWDQLAAQARESLTFVIAQLRMARGDRDNAMRHLKALQTNEGLKRHPDHQAWVAQTEGHIAFWTEQAVQWERSVRIWINHVRKARRGAREARR